MYPPPEQWEEDRKLLRRQWLSGGGGKGHVPWAHGSIMIAFTGCDADIATRVTSMGDMTGMVFLLLRKHRQSPQTLGAQLMAASG